MAMRGEGRWIQNNEEKKKRGHALLSQLLGLSLKWAETGRGKKDSGISGFLV